MTQTTQQAIDLPALADALVGFDGLFDLRDTHLALALYRLLAEGKPVSAEHLAARTGRPRSRAASWLHDARIDHDPQGAVIGFQGLTLRPTRFALEVNDHVIYAGCAPDALFIPMLLARPTRVRSTDPITGNPVSLTVDNGHARHLEPPTIVLSLAMPDAPIDDTAIPGACGPNNFFESPASGSRFIERVDGTFLLTIEEGLQLGRLTNQAVFGPALTGSPGGGAR